MNTPQINIPAPIQYIDCFVDLPNEIKQVIEELSTPWPIEQIQIRPGAINRDGTSAMALAYQEWWTGYLPRLNDVVGPNNFRIRLLPWNDDVIAHLRAFNGVIEGWSSGSAKQDKLGPMEAEMQAKKRVVAEKLMLGLYLYFLPPVWMRGTYDEQRHVFSPAEGEEQRCAYEMYVRAGLIDRPRPSVAIPSTASARSAVTPASDRVTVARAALDTAEQRLGMRPPHTPDMRERAPVPASDKQLTLILTLIGRLHTAKPDIINAIGARFQITNLARFTTRAHLPALRAAAGALSKLDASKLIDQLKACESPTAQAA
jgi:hypothetical protein